MKKIFFIATILLLYGCKTGLIKKELKNNLFEKFPISNWNNNFENSEKGERNNTYTHKGVEFYPTADNDAWCIYVYPQRHQFYTAYYEYDENKYIIKTKGKILGWSPYNNVLKIGIWYEYDDQGTLIKETDEDKKFGKFGYNELLQLLDKEKMINLRKGLDGDVNRDSKMDISFYYSDTSDKKLWYVFVHIGEAYDIPNLPNQIGSRISQSGKTYVIDGNTGEVITKNEETLNYYKEIGFNWF